MALSAALAIDIISQHALDEFNAQILPLNAFSTNFSADAIDPGKKIKFLWTPAGATVKDYDSGDGYESEEPTQLPKEMDIDQNKYVGFHYTDDQLATLTMLDLEKIGKQYGAALATAVLQDLWSLIKAASFTKVIPSPILAEDFDSDGVLDIGKQCTKANWPMIGRNLILNEDFYTELCKDLKDVSFSGTNDALKGRVIPGLGTFENVFQSTLIPENGEDLQGFAVNTEALGVAFRPVNPDASAQRVMDYRVMANESGMTICFKEWYEPKYKKTLRILEVNYGRAVGNPDALIRVVDA
jgi:hypothetical protein